MEPHPPWNPEPTVSTWAKPSNSTAHGRAIPTPRNCRGIAKRHSPAAAAALALLGEGADGLGQGDPHLARPIEEGLALLSVLLVERAMEVLLHPADHAPHGRSAALGEEGAHCDAQGAAHLRAGINAGRALLPDPIDDASGALRRQR